jgi:protein-disulfide isomerase
VQGRFKEAHRLLFSDPDSIGLRSWGSFAAQIGVPNASAFNACIQDSTQVAVIEKDEADARTLGVTVTPTLLLDDQFMGGGRPLAEMDQRIQRLLKK